MNFYAYESDKFMVDKNNLVLLLAADNMAPTICPFDLRPQITWVCAKLSYELECQ